EAAGTLNPLSLAGGGRGRVFSSSSPIADGGGWEGVFSRTPPACGRGQGEGLLNQILGRKHRARTRTKTETRRKASVPAAVLSCCPLPAAFFSDFSWCSNARAA